KGLVNFIKFLFFGLVTLLKKGIDITSVANQPQYKKLNDEFVFYRESYDFVEHNYSSFSG
ncbi:MAG TPA: hypothetical protein VIQ23_06140, partial [Hanamia sp.]